MDRSRSPLPPHLQYPLLCLPKTWTHLKPYCSLSDDLFINVNITTKDLQGNYSSIYNGQCSIKVVGTYVVVCPPELAARGEITVAVTEQPTDFSSRVWIDPARSPYVYNRCSEEETQGYTIETGTSHIIQHNTYVTQNVYNYNDAVHYTYESDHNRRMETQKPPSSDEEECEYEIVSCPPNKTMEMEDIEYLNAQNGALTQLMCPDIQSRKQRKTILYLGSAPQNGQTIQQIEYCDREIGCSAYPVEVDNEVVINEEQDEDSVIPRVKKYQCVSCHQLFDQISEFREHMGVHAGRQGGSQRTADADVRFTCSECSRVIKGREKFERHCVGHGDPDLECNKCHKVFASKSTLRAHRKIHNRKYPCKMCPRAYFNRSELSAHMNKKHYTFQCDQCEFSCTDSSDLGSHKQIHEFKYASENELTVSLFEDVTNDWSIPALSEEVVVEQEIQTTENGDFTRNVIEGNEDAARNEGRKERDDEYDAVSQEEMEQQVENGEMETACDSVIARVMSNQAFLGKRIRKHRKYCKVCNVCNKPFDRVSDLKRHLIEHVVRVTLARSPVGPRGLLNLRCELCLHTFHFVDSYKAHLREHANLTIYKCIFCNKQFSDSSNFSKHKKTHNATHFQCDLCQRKFHTKRTIIKHMEYHKTNKPVRCLYCDREFYFKSTLNKHLKNVHPKESYGNSRFKCRFCDDFSKSLKEKWDHEWRVHQVRKSVIDCPICDYKCRKINDLKRHTNDIHNMLFTKRKADRGR